MTYNLLKENETIPFSGTLSQIIPTADFLWYYTWLSSYFPIKVNSYTPINISYSSHTFLKIWDTTPYIHSSNPHTAYNLHPVHYTSVISTDDIFTSNSFTKSIHADGKELYHRPRWREQAIVDKSLVFNHSECFLALFIYDHAIL